MGNTNLLRWLSKTAASGVKDLPSNAAWVFSKALAPPPVEKAAGSAKDTARRMSAAVQDTVPGSHSLDTRLKRAREATERAQTAENEALDQATEAKRLVDEDKAEVEDGRKRIRQAKSAAAEDVKRQVAEARRQADEMVEERRTRAQTKADESVRKVTADVDGRVEKSRERADRAQEGAQQAVSDATEQMAEARRLADEAAKEAQAAAAQAQRRAEELAGEARRHAGATDDQLAEAQHVQQEAAGTAADVTTQLRASEVDGDLKSMNKDELMDLAVALDVDRRASMTKQQLVAAINRESKKARPSGGGHR